MKTEIIVILDRSGSMGPLAAEVMSGFNSFVEDQKKESGEARLTLVQFDHEYELKYQGVPIENVDKLEFQPRGMTAMNDAIGRTLNEQGKRIAEQKWAELVIVNIITDGEENSSQEYTRARVAEMVKHAEKHGWLFLFLASNIDAKATAQAFGSSAKYAGAVQASGAGMQFAYNTMSATAASLRSVGDANLVGLVVKP